MHWHASAGEMTSITKTLTNVLKKRKLPKVHDNKREICLKFDYPKRKQASRKQALKSWIHSALRMTNIDDLPVMNERCILISRSDMSIVLSGDMNCQTVANQTLLTGQTYDMGTRHSS